MTELKVWSEIRATMKSKDNRDLVVEWVVIEVDWVLCIDLDVKSSLEEEKGVYTPLSELSNIVELWMCELDTWCESCSA